ncbi:MAG: NlpC/P60 family protein [Candidatus Nanopelagicales bacterium]
MPADCPSVADARARLAAWLGQDGLQRICSDAMALAVSYEAETAIKWAFGRLGTPYSQGGSQRENWYFDCATLVGRAYRAAGAQVQAANGATYDYYPYFLWTGSYTGAIRPITSIGGGHLGTNVRRISRAELAPGDIVIKFNGGDPIGSAGNAGHAQLYLGNDWLIEAGGKADYSNVDLGRMSFDPDTPNEWYFRYDTRGWPKFDESKMLAGGMTYKMKVGQPNQTVIGNLTVVDPVSDGHTRLFTCGTPLPMAASSQFTARRTSSTLATVALDGEGSLCVYLSARAHLLWDQTWMGTTLAAHAAFRRADTRPTGGLPAGGVLAVDTGAPDRTVLATLSVVDPQQPGHTRVFPCDADGDGQTDAAPMASVNNFGAGQRSANLAVVRADRFGRVCVYASVAAGVLWDQVLETDAVAAHVPVRQFDSRLPAGSPIANNAGHRLDPNDPGKIVRIRVGVPGASVIGNLTVLGSLNPGHTKVFPCAAGANSVVTSASNFAAGQAVPNAVLARADAQGEICVRATDWAHVIWDQSVETSALPAYSDASPRKIDSRAILGRPRAV